MAHIFISYSHKDTEYAHSLAGSLQKMGFETWIDERLDYGAQWPQELQKQLDTCSAFILIMSPRSYASEWVQSELQRARRKLKPIFPLLLEGDEPWLSVESTQYYDVRGGVYPDAKFYAALKKVIMPTPAVQPLQTPEGPVKAGVTTNAFNRNTVVMIIGGILLVAVLGLAILMGSLFGNRLNPATAEASPAQPPSSANTGESEMVLVPAGEFAMGGNAVDELKACQELGSECNIAWFMDEEPVHNVDVKAFYIDIYEVTNSSYQACEQAGVCDSPQASNSSTRSDYYGNSEFDQYPVIHVNWNQAKTYCEWRGARLPTEAEWEKAARGTDGRLYPWGDEVEETFANFHYNTGDTTAVGTYPEGKSPYGLYDMAGNVWEWVSSLHQPYPYDASDGRESLTASGLRVARGGSWGLVGASVSSAYRYGFNSTHSDLDLGFRCATDAN